MSKVFKRPMFRKGGPAMEGVMNGIEDRTNFNTGDLVRQAQERKKLLQSVLHFHFKNIINFLLLIMI